MAVDIRQPERRGRSRCPYCPTSHGVAFQVNATRRMHQIAYRCELCGNEWNIDSMPRDIELQLSADHS